MSSDDKPVLIIGVFGTKYWYLGKDHHREDGPAIEQVNGHKEWYQHDKLHREDGPAVETLEGYKSWYWHGEKLGCTTQEEFERLMKLKALW